MADQWMVYDPYDGHSFFASEDEALAAGSAVIEEYLADEVWNEDVLAVVVAKVVARPTRVVLGRRSEMDEDAWNQMTGGSDADEWWDFPLVASVPSDGEGEQ